MCYSVIYVEVALGKKNSIQINLAFLSTETVQKSKSNNVNEIGINKDSEKGSDDSKA